MKLIPVSLMAVVAGCLCHADEPLLSTNAVSGVNGKLDYVGGYMNSQVGHNLSGSLSVPIGRHFGIQADGLFTRVADREFYGGGGHLFWRNPEIGLVGLAGGVVREDFMDSYQAVVEGEYYWKWLTVGLAAGVGGIHYDTPAPFIDTDVTEFTGGASVSAYPVDDLMISGSYARMFGNNLWQARVEYQTPINRLAITADLARGDHGYDHALFGLRLYLGKQKSLKSRHREDDPAGFMQRLLYGVGIYGAEFNEKWNDYDLANGLGGSGSSHGSYGVVSTMYSYYIPYLPPLPPTTLTPPELDPTGSPNP